MCVWVCLFMFVRLINFFKMSLMMKNSELVSTAKPCTQSNFNLISHCIEERQLHLIKTQSNKDRM